MPYPNLIPFPLSLLILYILMILPGVAPTYGRPPQGREKERHRKKALHVFSCICLFKPLKVVHFKVFEKSCSDTNVLGVYHWLNLEME